MIIVDRRTVGVRIGFTKDRRPVFDLNPTHVRIETRAWVPSALAQLVPAGDGLQFYSVRFAGKIWSDALIADVPESECFYAVRQNRDWPSRLVDRDPTPTGELTLGIIEVEGVLYLWSVYPGKIAPREPSDLCFAVPRTPVLEVEFGISRPFWNTHALSSHVFQYDSLTRTPICPWEQH